MTELKAMFEAAGFTNVRTYIANGNVVFDSALTEETVVKKLAASLEITYPGGSGASKLKIPAAAAGTARNMNTIARLAEMGGA